MIKKYPKEIGKKDIREYVCFRDKVILEKHELRQILNLKFENPNHQKWLYIALAVIFLIFSGVILGNIEKIKLTANDKNKKFIILFSFLWCLLIFDTIIMLFGPLPEIGLIDYDNDRAGVSEGDVLYFGAKWQINF